MTKTELVEKIKIFYSEKNKIKIEKLLKNYLKNFPQDTDAWLRLAIVEINPPFADGYRAIECTKKILEYDENNVKALLLYWYADFYCFGDVRNELYNKLINVDCGDNEEQSMIEFAKAGKFYWNKEQLYETYLLKSIILCDKYVYNHYDLADYYYKRDSFLEAEVHAKKALTNVQSIYEVNRIVDDYTDVDEFISERIKGIYLTQSNFKSLEELLENIRKRKAEKI